MLRLLSKCNFGSFNQLTPILLSDKKAESALTVDTQRSETVTYYNKYGPASYYAGYYYSGPITLQDTYQLGPVNNGYRYDGTYYYRGTYFTGTGTGHDITGTKSEYSYKYKTYTDYMPNGTVESGTYYFKYDKTYYRGYYQIYTTGHQAAYTYMDDTSYYYRATDYNWAPGYYAFYISKWRYDVSHYADKTIDDGKFVYFVSGEYVYHTYNEPLKNHMVGATFYYGKVAADGTLDFSYSVYHYYHTGVAASKYHVYNSYFVTSRYFNIGISAYDITDGMPGRIRNRTYEYGTKLIHIQYAKLEINKDIPITFPDFVYYGKCPAAYGTYYTYYKFYYYYDFSAQATQAYQKAYTYNYKAGTDKYYGYYQYKYPNYKTAYKAYTDYQKYEYVVRTYNTYNTYTYNKYDRYYGYYYWPVELYKYYYGYYRYTSDGYARYYRYYYDITGPFTENKQYYDRVYINT